jgi:nucleotide-binding universal stress UspA family protein
MFKNVLVGVDGRAGGRDAIALAGRLMDDQGQLALVHVHQETTGIVVHDFDSSARDEAQRLLEGERDAAAVTAKLVSIAAPSVGSGLHHLADETAADLLVVGTCRHGFVGRVLLRDDALASLAGAPCAVAIPPLGYAQRSKPIGVIGVGYDPSPESRAALDLARVLAAEGNVKIKVLTIVSTLPFSYAGLAPMDLSKEIDVLLDEARDRLNALDDVEGEAVYGLPGEELALFGDDVDLLLVGSRSYGPQRHLMLGSTSEHLARASRCPLLVLPRAGAQEVMEPCGGAIKADGSAGRSG